MAPLRSDTPPSGARRGFTRRQWTIAGAGMLMFAAGMLALLRFPLFGTADPFTPPVGAVVAAVWLGVLAVRLGRTPSRPNLLRKLVFGSLPLAVGLLGAAHLVNAAFDDGRPSVWPYAVAGVQSAGRSGTETRLVPRGSGPGGPPLTVPSERVGGAATPVGTPFDVEVKPGWLRQAWVVRIRRAIGP